MNPTTVLFLSTGNAARGILAEALLRHKAGDRFVAMSAGYKMLPAVDAQVLSILKAEGISTDGLHTKGWQELFAAPQSIFVDVIVTLSEEARGSCPQWPGDPVRVHWPVDDPLAAANEDARDWKLRKCFSTLQNRVDALIKQRRTENPAELMLQLRGIAAVV
ncbi:MAG: arsenate reductase ArsC [Alphaproteobacteria bacterium]|nr:arsenate reductase ArsC [Alphaproteobacteria bacterium]